ncbi:MAG: OmpA family protein [Rhodobacteraceae bacterium]|nr:OmpA family protein [Paracoccaceae bacterium]
MVRPLLALLVLLSGPAGAEVLTLPAGWVVTAEETLARGELRVATGPWTPAGLPLRRADGRLARTAWRTPPPAAGTLGLLAAFRSDLLAQGYAILFDCADRDCGGFDFRFALDVLPEPAMHVDLGDFRYLAAEAEEGGTLVALLVSRSRGAGHVQLSRLDPEGASPPGGDPAPAPPGGDPAPAAVPGVAGDGLRPAPRPGAPAARPPAAAPVPADAAALGRALEGAGAVALDDLAFEAGAARLGPGPFASLAALAGWLAADPGRRVVLVGHSDATGSLAANIALSRQRAEAVAARLVDAHGTRPAQVAAEGVGYLAPRDTNLTPAGRTRNRRVEAVLVGIPPG